MEASPKLMCAAPRGEDRGTQEPSSNKEVENLGKVLPKQYVSTVLHLAHSDILGGGKDRIMNRYHWPGVVMAVTDYCRTCPSVTRGHLNTIYKMLIPLPIIDQIAMDLGGPK